MGGVEIMKAPNWENRTLFHADNLDILCAMNSNTVNLIATDPPFNKGKDFHATPDSLAAGASFQDRWSWENDIHEEWIDQIQNEWQGVWYVINAARKAYGDDMAAFLCFMAVRLIEMHRVLLHCVLLHCVIHLPPTKHAVVLHLSTFQILFHNAFL